MKDVIFHLIHLLNCILRPIQKCGETINRIKQYYYSDKYCQTFNCRNCYFLHPVNFITGQKYFKIGYNTGFGKMVVLTAWDEYLGQRFTPEVTIGNNCNFGDFLHLTCINRVRIGDGVLTGRWVTITDNGHGTSEDIIHNKHPKERALFSKGAIIIKDNVWIGDKVTILSDVTIGEGSIIGANSVVTKDVPPYCIVAGNPAVIIKQINDEQA